MKTSPLMIVALILVVALLMSPQIFAIFNDIMAGLYDLWGQLWNWGTSSNQQTSVGFWVEYMNGTKQEFNPETIVPLTVFYGDTPIRAFGLQTWIRLTYTQDVESISGTVDMDLYFDQILKTRVSNHPITQAPPTSGEWTKVTGAVISYTSQKIEEWDASQFKTHTLKCISDIELTVNFEDNTSSDLSGSAYGSMDLRVVQSATLEMEVRGISVALSTSPLL